MPNRSSARAASALLFSVAACSNAAGSPTLTDASAAHVDARVSRRDAGSAQEGGRKIDSGSGGIDAPSRATDAAATSDAADASFHFAATTSVAAVTANNTSACGSDAAPCTAAWTATHAVTYGSGSTYAGTTVTVDGFWDEPVPSGARAPASVDGYVSKMPVTSLLPGYDVPIWVETQNWWGAGDGHIDNGESSKDSEQIADQVADQVSRGFAGQVVDWYGPGTTADVALPFIQTSAEAAAGKYGFAVMIDKGYLQACGDTVTCLNSGVAYIVDHYGASSAYLKDAGGHPLIFFFINQYYGPQYALLTGSGVDADGSLFVMYEPNGFPGDDPPNTTGEYGWVNPADGAGSTSTSGTQGTFAWETDFGFKDLTGFLSNASNNQGSFIVAAVYKGFDDNLANWSLNRIIDEQCGSTWLETFDHTGSFGGNAAYSAPLNYLATGKRLDMVMVDTWDDYEEGTEIETGIDNCLASLVVTLSGTNLSWAPTWSADPMNADIVGSEASLYGYRVYLANAGASSLMRLTDLACSGGACPHTLDVSTLGIKGGPYVFYIEALGLPSIVNHLGGPTVMTFMQ